jgi:hypothetical protein
MKANPIIPQFPKTRKYIRGNSQGRLHQT